MKLKLLTTAILAVLLASSWPIGSAAAEDDAVPAPSLGPNMRNLMPCNVDLEVGQLLSPTLNPNQEAPCIGTVQTELAYYVDRIPCGTKDKPPCDMAYVCSRPKVDCTPEVPQDCPEPKLGVTYDGFAYCINVGVDGLPCGGAGEPDCVDYVCNHPYVNCSRDLPGEDASTEPCEAGYIGTQLRLSDNPNQNPIRFCIHIPSQVPNPCGTPGKPDCPSPRVPEVFCAEVLGHCVDADCDDLTGDANCGTGTFGDFVEEETPAVLVLAGKTAAGTFTLHQSVPLPDGTWTTRAMSESTAEPNVRCGAMTLGYAHAQDMTCEQYFPLHNVDTMWVFYGAKGCDCATTGSTKNYMSHQHDDGSAHGKGWRVNWANGQALAGNQCQEYAGQGGKVLHADWMFGGISTDSSGYCNTPSNPWAYPYGYWGAGLTFK